MKNVFKLLAIAIAANFLFSCNPSNRPSQNIAAAKSSNAASIINGQVVTEDNELGQHTVGLMIKYGPTWYQSCSGSIIAKDMILTAAHCVRGIYSNNNIVINFSLGTMDYDTQSNPATEIKNVRATFNTIDVAGIRSHPNYYGYVDHDIAVIQLKQNIPPTHKPVEFLPENFIDPSGQKLTLDGQTHDVTLLGFGVISEDPVTDTTVLRMTTVPAQFKGTVLVTDQTHSTGACNGDSGGPAFIKINDKNYLVGVTHGPHPGSKTCHEYGDYVNPNLEMNFIREAILKLKQQN
jgi:secreted trypsin-like serine protease